MKYLIFDTETNGLPKYKEMHSTNPHWYKEWPHIVQISWLLFDSERNKIINVTDYVAKLPQGVDIPESASNIHGITKEMSEEKGTDIQKIMYEFNIMLKHTDVIVGHNIEFDLKMIRALFLKNGAIDPFVLNKHIDVYCTMKKGIDICKIEAVSKYGKRYYKWPKLIELHKKLFNTEPNDLHNSLTDIYVTLRCFCVMEFSYDLMDFTDFERRTRKIFR